MRIEGLIPIYVSVLSKCGVSRKHSSFSCYQEVDDMIHSVTTTSQDIL